jgi:hypothetical protein
MTAYLTLQRYPLSGAQDGSMITITAAQADAATEDAADQLRVFERAMRFPVFRHIVSLPSVTLPIGDPRRRRPGRSSWSTPSTRRAAGQRSPSLPGLVPPARTATRGYSLPVRRARTDVQRNHYPQENT